MKKTLNQFKRITGYTLMSIMVLTPAFAFAKESGNEGKNNGKSYSAILVNKPTTSNKAMAELAKNARRSSASTTLSVKKNDDKDKKDEKDNDGNKGKGNLQSCFVKLSKFTIADILNLNLPTTTSLATICFGLATTTPDVTAPVIKSFTATVGSTTASVVVKTDEASKVKVFFGTSTVDTSSTSVSFVQSSNFEKETKLTISGLTSSTGYNLITAATDKSGNVTLSGIVHVVTNASTTADVTPPVLSALGTTSASTSINVVWATNELATSKVYFSTTTPVSTSTASFMENISLVASHVISIPGLMVNTIYRLIIESKDAAGNIVNSFEFPISTTAI